MLIVELNTSLADALGIKTMWGNRLERKQTQQITDDYNGQGNKRNFNVH